MTLRRREFRLASTVGRKRAEVGLLGKSAAVAAAPSAPRSLAGHDGGNGDAVLAWSAPATGAVTGYKVYRGLSSGGETLLTTLGNVLTYDDTNPPRQDGVTPNYYKVTAINAVGESSASNEVSVVVFASG